MVLRCSGRLQLHLVDLRVPLMEFDLTVPYPVGLWAWVFVAGAFGLGWYLGKKRAA